MAPVLVRFDSHQLGTLDAGRGPSTPSDPGARPHPARPAPEEGPRRHHDPRLQAPWHHHAVRRPQHPRRHRPRPPLAARALVPAAPVLPVTHTAHPDRPPLAPPLLPFPSFKPKAPLPARCGVYRWATSSCSPLEPPSPSTLPT